MKNKLLTAVMLCSFAISVNATERDSTQSNDIIDVRLERTADTLNTAKLFVRNLLSDTISINSKFFIDEFKPCRIWIYYCEYSTEKDSIICKDGYFYDAVDPKYLSFNTKRWIDIPPQRTISLEIPLFNPYFNKGEVYLDVQFAVFANNTSQFISKVTNKIYFEIVKSRWEKYQEEKRLNESHIHK
jgi:hypothetical protein